MNDFNTHFEDLKIWFLKRGCPDNIIKEQVKKTLRLTPSDENNSIIKLNGEPLLLTYNPASKSLFQVIRKKP